jgi:glycosyltransferase involved in cell wall biosynthesis
MNKPVQPDMTCVVLVKNDEFWLSYALEASRGFFERYVIYDIGSSDRTPEVIEWFQESEKHRTDFFIRMMPHCDPTVQGAFRNSMFAEARSEWVFMLDADEIYTPQGYEAIRYEMRGLERLYEEDGVMYGLVPRIEVRADLKKAYGLDCSVPHHRVYHRTAIFKGTHPGEEPVYQQKEAREMWFDNDAACYHFHNAYRSTKDAEVPGRISRRGKATYHPGRCEEFNLLKKLPLLQKNLTYKRGKQEYTLPVSPMLEELRETS